MRTAGSRRHRAVDRTVRGADSMNEGHLVARTGDGDLEREEEEAKGFWRAGRRRHVREARRWYG